MPKRDYRKTVRAVKRETSIQDAEYGIVNFKTKKKKSEK